MTLPLIGITTYKSTPKNSNPFYACSYTYTKAVAYAGGLPVLVPLGLDDQALEALFDKLDGILFPGGGDIAPEIFGALNGSKAENINPDRDRIELFLAKRARDEGKPFFGICRGFQVVNVAFGGTLYVDIAGEKTGALKHDYYPDIPRNFLAHEVQVAPGSRLAGILGESAPGVNSLHHQGALDIAPGTLPVAHAPDGLVEAVELPDHPFGLAVQWHPEELQEHESMRRLFRAFVEAASR
jgi:putative glutamine amidotransferase